MGREFAISIAGGYLYLYSSRYLKCYPLRDQIDLRKPEKINSAGYTGSITVINGAIYALQNNLLICKLILSGNPTDEISIDKFYKLAHSAPEVYMARDADITAIYDGFGAKFVCRFVEGPYSVCRAAEGWGIADDKKLIFLCAEEPVIYYNSASLAQNCIYIYSAGLFTIYNSGKIMQLEIDVQKIIIDYTGSAYILSDKLIKISPFGPQWQISIGANATGIAIDGKSGNLYFFGGDFCGKISRAGKVKTAHLEQEILTVIGSCIYLRDGDMVLRKPLSSIFY